MTISGPFIRRPIATSLLSAAVVLAGIAAYGQLPISPLPRVDFPTISISASLPGASPETMASSVAAPLERRFGRIAGVSQMTSASSLGSASITLQFDLDRNVDAAARDVQAAINAAGGELPPDLPSRPSYRKVNPSESPILILALTSDTITPGQMYDTANTIFAEKISQVPGVGQVNVGGGQNPAVRVQVDPEALAGVGMSMSDVQKVLATSSVILPKGTLVGRMQTHTVDANDQLQLAAGYKDLILNSVNGAPVRLSDVAEVFDSVQDERVAGWTYGAKPADFAGPNPAKRSVLVIVRRQPGANVIAVCDSIVALLPLLKASISPAINVQLALNRTVTIRAAVADVQRTLLISILLVVVVVFVFLRTWRATAIPSVAVPLSLLGTCAMMYLMGYSIDNLSLMALTISTGFVVDDAIVVTENIARYVEQGEAPMQAAFKGAKQIGFTIVSITCSLMAVFIPILLMGGIVGRLFREFAFVLCIAIGFSAVVSLTLTPMMASRLLRVEHGEHGWFYRTTEAAFDWMLHIYDVGLIWVLKHQRIMQGVTLGGVAVTVGLFLIVPKGLFPQQDTGTIQGVSDAPQDVSFPSMVERTQRIMDVLKADPDINHAVGSIGAGSYGGTTCSGTFFIELKPREGKNARTNTADQVIGRLRKKLADVEGIKLSLQASQDLNVGGRLARTQFQYTIQDASLDELNVWAPKILGEVKKIKEVKDVATDQQTDGLELDVDIDRDMAYRLGLSAQQIDNTLYQAFGQSLVSVNYTELNQYWVVLEAKPADRAHPEDLTKIFMRTPSGTQVPLSTFATMHTSKTLLSVNHQGQFPAVTISFNLAEGKSLSDAITQIKAAEKRIGLPPAIHADFQGTAQAFTDSLKTEPWLLAAAILTVYMVLGMLYESYIHPITILSTLPSAGVGAFLALLLFHTEFNVIAMIGMILLIGIVKKNGIMMIDFALEAEREEGLAPVDAIHKACLLRFRPIMMTTLAALLGGLPLALGTGTGSELRRPLGITIVGGLLLSQLITLYTTPVIYLALDRFTNKQRHGQVPIKAPNVPEASPTTA